MPALSMFYGVIVYMYHEKGGKHHTPHIHVQYQDEKAVVSLDGELLAGSIPKKKLNLVIAWITIHEDALRANWELLQKKEPSFKIEPLK